jgi:hypothetical protein
MRTRWLAGLVSSCFAVVMVGCGQLDTADRVHDLRLLAIRATPPEQVLPVAFTANGSVLSTIGQKVPTPPAPVTVTALLADPAGAGREVSYRFSTCVQLDSDTRRCTEDTPAYQVLSEGTVVPTDLGAEPSVTFSPDYKLIGELVRRDSLHGFGGVNLPVQIEITAGDESVAGFKRVTFEFGTPPLPPPNHNPELQALDYNGATWLAEAMPQFLAASAPTRGIPGTGGADGGTDTGTNTVTPIVDPAGFEEYDRPTFDGEPPVHFTETWRYSYFATRGSFSPGTAGGGNAATGNDGSTASRWSTVEGQTSAGPMTVWVVVRDGRGGESWVARRALAPAARR